MRVILRTPAEVVVEYDLPELDSSSSDKEVLAAAAVTEPLRRAETEIVGEPYVYARGLDGLAQQGRLLEQLSSRLEAEKLAARQVAQKYVNEGHAKREVAVALGITRPTLDSWLGEGATRRRKGAK